MRRAAGRAAIALSAALVTLLGAPPGAAASAGGTGPAFDVPQASLASGLRCSSDLDASARDPILFIPGTATTPGESFDWNYIPLLSAQGYPYCTVTVPDQELDAVPTSAEYVADAIRTMHRQTGRRVDIIGWSQGAGPMPRWALKYWPDTRSMVDHLIALDPDNRGTAVTYPMCTNGCAPSLWQQRPDSRFMRALNHGRMTFPEVAYTVVYSRVDDIVFPDIEGEMAALPGAPNVADIAVQDVCRAQMTTFDHAQVLVTPPAYAAILDSLEHPGEPADPARFPASTCESGLAPGVTPEEAASGIAHVYEVAFPRVLSRHDRSEPPLPAYAGGWS